MPGIREWQQGKIRTYRPHPLEPGPKKVDVEVDGEAVHRTAGGGRKDDDHWRDLQLQSLGWKVCRFWVYELREDLTHCTQKVISILTS